MSNRLLTFLNHLYEASLEQDRWPAVMAELADLLDVRSAGIVVHDRIRSSYHVLAYTGLPGLLVKGYSAGLARYDVPWTLMRSHPPGKAVQLLDQSEARRHHPIYFRMLMKPAGIHFMAGMKIYQDDEWEVGLGVHRSAHSSPFQPETLGLINDLYPHLKRVVRIQRQFSRLNDQSSALQSALSHLIMGVIVVDAGMRVSYVSPVAKQTLASHPALQLQDGHLSAHYSEEGAELNLAIRRLLKARGAAGERTLAVGMTHPERDTILTVLLARTTLPEEEYRPGGCGVILYISDPSADLDIPTEALGGLYGLSPAEGRIAVSLVNGLTLREIASRNQSSIETVRSQVRSIFNKTGVNRQQDLIRLLLNGGFFLNPAQTTVP